MTAEAVALKAVFHDAFVRVDENGTEATASTAVVGEPQRHMDIEGAVVGDSRSPYQRGRLLRRGESILSLQGDRVRVSLRLAVASPRGVMRTRSATIALVFLSGGFTLHATAPTAAAQTGARNPAAAQGLYDEARQLVQAGKYADACPKFKASYELDPGGGTLLNLADCYEKEGKTALAWSTFKDALVAAQRGGRSERVEFANQHIASLEARLARLTVQVAGAARVPGLSIALDGTPLAEAAWGVAVPVDPGTHGVRAEAPGKRPFETSIDVPPGSAARVGVDVPALADAEATPPPLAATSSPAAEGQAAGPNTRATVGWIVGGVGVASIGVASYFGLRAFSQWSERKADCAGGCTADAKTAGDSASQAATISDIGFGVGLAAVAVGTYLVLSGHKEPTPTASAGAALRVAPSPLPGGAGVLVRGAW